MVSVEETVESTTAAMGPLGAPPPPPLLAPPPGEGDEMLAAATAAATERSRSASRADGGRGSCTTSVSVCWWGREASTAWWDSESDSLLCKRRMPQVPGRSR